MAGRGGRTSTSGQGRPKGIPNKATMDARQAIAGFVDNNADRLQGWLDAIADGVKNDDGDYVVTPNPEKAFNLFQSVIEYHVPKLARTVIAGDSDNPLKVKADVTVAMNFDEVRKRAESIK